MSDRERLSSADAAWLRMDRPTNLMVITSVLLFGSRLDWERLAEIVQERLVDRYPRFRQRVVESRRSPGGPAWVPDERFDLARHMHRRGLRAPGNEAALQELVGDLASTPLDRGKPLWDMYMVDGPGRGSAVIVRMHHCIADGIALAEVMLSLTDSSARPKAPAGPPSVQSSDGATRGGLGATLLADAGGTVLGGLSAAQGASAAALRVSAGVAREALRTAARPAHGVELAGRVSSGARALAKLLLTLPDQPSVLKGDQGTARKVSWGRAISLAEIKAIAHAQDATVNDVLLAAVSGALRSHLLSRGEDPHEIRAFVPVNLRASGQPVPRELGNRFGLVYLTLPVDRASRRERLRELKRRMDEIKHSPEGVVSYVLLEAVGLTPPEVESRLIDLFTMKATAVMTNVPGPRKTVYLAGTPLRAVLVWAPTAGSMGTSVSIFSYDGEVTVGLLVHSALVPDPQSIVDRLDRELAAMARLAPSRTRRASAKPAARRGAA